MQENRFSNCFDSRPFILTEGAVGLRLEHEYRLRPDENIMYAPLIYSAEGRRALKEIYGGYLSIAQEFGLPLILLTNTRRANRERVMRSAYRDQNVMRDYAAFLRETADKFRCETYVGGMMGCRGDAYTGEGRLSFAEAADFHIWQRLMFEEAAIDFLFAGIMPALPEAGGMAKVMASSGLPYIISFMLRRDGCLPDGTPLARAINEIDRTPEARPICYMANCIHPNILRAALTRPFNDTEAVRKRFAGIQANAAELDPEGLDGSASIRTSSAEDFGGAMRSLLGVFPLKILGGCCGTDGTHIRAVAKLQKTFGPARR